MKSPDIKQAANGRWREIITTLASIDPESFDGRHGPCPKCGGSDRFRAFEDFAKTGGVFCNQCHSDGGDGFATLMWLNDWKFPEATKAVADNLGVKTESNGKPKRPVDKIRQLAQSSEAEKLLTGWLEIKLGIAIGAIEAFGGKPVAWPKSGISSAPCLAFYGRSLAKVASVKSVLLYRLDGLDFEPVGKLGKRKTHLVGGSDESWIWPGTFDDLKVATVIIKCEGVTDALAVWSLGLPDGWLPITNSCGAKSTRKLKFDWAASTTVLVVGDADKPGQLGATKFGKAFFDVDADSVKLLQLPFDIEPTRGKDTRDWIIGGATIDDLKALADATPPLTANDVAQMVPQRTTSEHEVILGTDEERVANEAIEALAARADIYQRGGCLAHIVYDVTPSRGIDRPSNSPQIKTLPEARLRELMTTVADFVVVDEDDGKKNVHPPVWAIRAVAARGQWAGIRPIESVVESPIMRPDGSILQTPGYDAATASFYSPQIDFPEVDDNPNKADAQRAAAELLDVVIDFPFDKPEHKSAWLASLLTPLCRTSFAGPSPLFAVDANVRGSGKSLLTDCVSVIVSGHDFARMAAPKEDEEARKRITAIAMTGEPLVLIDNIHGSLGSAALDAALTSTKWSDRILGKNEMVTMPLNVTWFASGNNISLEADTARRVCHIRLESPKEKPEDRSDFQHPDLLAWVKDNRGRLAVAALTILRAYHFAGRPTMGLKPWGSFQGWSDVVRQAIVWAGLPDPGESRKELTDNADTEAGILLQLLEGWEEVAPSGREMTVSAAIKVLAEQPQYYQTLRDAFQEITPAGRPINARSIGGRFRKMRNRVVDGKRFASRRMKGRKHWRVEKTEGNHPSGGGTESCTAPSAPPFSSTAPRTAPQSEATKQEVLAFQGAEGAVNSNPYVYAGAHAHARTRDFNLGGNAAPAAPQNENHLTDQQNTEVNDFLGS